MELILQVMGSNMVTTAVILVLICCACGLWLRRRFSRSYQASGQTAGRTPALAARMTLHAGDAIEWMHPQQVQELSKRLQNLGFGQLGDFAIRQMPEKYLRAWGHPGKKLVAAIYDQAVTAPLFEVAVFYSDDTCLTVSSGNLPEMQDNPPQNIVISQPGLKPKQALELITQYDTGKTRKAVDRTMFIEEIQQCYARKIDWQIKHGTLSEGFIQLTAQTLIGHDFDEDELEAARLQSEANMAALIEDACLDNFFRQSRLDVRDWDNLRATMFVVHERMDREEIVGTIAAWLDDDKELHLLDLSESLYDISGIELFRQINQTLPEKQRMIEMGRIEEPLNACIYMAPG